MNKVLAAFLGIDILFAATGGLILGFSFIVQNTSYNTPLDGHTAARDLLYQKFPFSAGIGNGIFALLTFIATIPALLATQNRRWLKAVGVLIVVNAVFTLVIGLQLWILTLRLKDTLADLWGAQDAPVQSLMQGSFNCCGFHNSTAPLFATDATCPDAETAALIMGCASPLSRFGNTFIDDVFTALFGVVGVDVVLIIALICLLKERKEIARYRLIDEKMGARETF